MPETWSLLFKGQNSLPAYILVRYGSFIANNLPHFPVFLYSPKKEKGSSIPIFITTMNSQITNHISHTLATNGFRHFGFLRGQGWGLVEFEGREVQTSQGNDNKPAGGLWRGATTAGTGPK